ncbi:hypothetical protein BU24DRAFT_492293 [Aaosphaeria arxii CBS 175.79]|uniref:Centromere protein H C-terminal domain-containing protein n=1 Tax=Aaosphaeria arxii CBS 175.79 TaxID=1450172 RepID=A0A6A5XSI7_9PLEO|nr:uncharacterized protein BU24DRAFT_492293 [Aaosphaeria arxii CBS 175.79]KAF2016142.1 hypothetical protein BU24DRAFT_492293 [Aaosphaeria arxii CBS 175.79]
MSTTNDVVMNENAPESSNTNNDYSNLLKSSHCDAFAFSDQEQLALQLYDQLKELELQQSLLTAQSEVIQPDVSALSDDDVREQLITAEREMMKARAEYEIRAKATHNVLVMNPTLKAVHGGEDTDYSEKRLLPLIHERDIISMVHGMLNAKMAATTRALSTAEEENMAANQKNTETASVLLKLAEDLKRQSAEDIEDVQLRGKVDAVQKELKGSRSRLRTLKGIISGMIVGSGIDWADDEVLRELVMDDDEDG